MSLNNLLQALRGRRESERYLKSGTGEGGGGGGEKRKFPPILLSCSRFLYPRGPEYLRAWNRLIKNPSSSTLIHWIVRNFKIPGAYRGHLTTIISRHCWGGHFDCFFFLYDRGCFACKWLRTKERQKLCNIFDGNV